MKRVLVIDDDEQIRRLIVRILKTLQEVEVDQIGNGLAAASLHASQPYDLIITDIIMPEKEGVETIMELLHVDASVKIIAISGGGKISSTDCLLMAKRLGALQTFEKPFQREAFLDAVRTLLDLPAS